MGLKDDITKAAAKTIAPRLNATSMGRFLIEDTALHTEYRNNGQFRYEEYDPLVARDPSSPESISIIEQLPVTEDPNSSCDGYTVRFNRTHETEIMSKDFVEAHFKHPPKTVVLPKLF